MAEAASWTCEDPDCGFTVVEPNKYRCPKCDKVKPYISTPSSPSSSLPVSEQSPDVQERVPSPRGQEPDLVIPSPYAHASYLSESRRLDGDDALYELHKIKDDRKGELLRPASVSNAQFRNDVVFKYSNSIGRPLLQSNFSSSWGNDFESVRCPSQNERDSAVRTFDVHTNYASSSRNPTQLHSSGLEHETDNTEDEMMMPVGAYNIQTEPYCDDIQFPDKECRLVLLGKTGNGKSDTGNSILGRDAFDVRAGLNSVTRECQLQRARRFGLKVQVVDTCGLYDTHIDKEEIIKEIGKCLSISSPGPHALILVLKYSQRFTQEEVDALRELRKIFGESALQKTIVVFTHTDELWRDTTDDKEARKKFRKTLEESPDSLKQFIKKIDDRYLLINNTGTKRHRDRQVRQLLEIIARMTKGAEGQHCSSVMQQEIERIMQSEEDKCLQETGFRPTEGDRERIRNELRDDIEKGKRPSLLRRIIEAIKRFFRRKKKQQQ